MSDVSRKRELGRGERVLPGVFRLRLPLPWPGVPHCNAWAVSAGDGFVLFDTGMQQEGSMENLERALAMCNLRLEDTRLVVCTHAHSDHCGQAATIV
ncbi:MAG TPA: MBL fold metallo-hydrolase, partial [Solirubrobacteraceae bacterium]